MLLPFAVRISSEIPSHVYNVYHTTRGLRQFMTESRHGRSTPAWSCVRLSIAIRCAGIMSEKICTC